jgi:2-polyprenyl-6-hydroxyphenyl methylase / 3-demethylubiquinone-9 3-methyltransferase
MKASKRKRNDQQLFRDNAGDWWSFAHRPERMMAALVRPRLAYFDRIVADWKRIRVLDLGCGGGFMSEALASRGADVIGIDPVVPLIETARRHARIAYPAISYLAGRGESIPLADGSIDRIVCVDVLEHVDDVDRVLAESRRVLRSGGLFLFDTVNRNLLTRLAMVTLAEDLLRIIRRGTHDPDRFIRPEELGCLLQRNGFAVDTREFSGMGPTGLNRRLDFVIGRWPITSFMYLGYAVAE